MSQGLGLGRVNLITIYFLYSTASVVAQSIELVSAGLQGWSYGGGDLSMLENMLIFFY